MLRARTKIATLISVLIFLSPLILLASSQQLLNVSDRNRIIYAYQKSIESAENQAAYEKAYFNAQKIIDIYNANQPDSALVWVNIAYKMARALKDQGKQSVILMQRSELEFQAQQYDQSISTALKVLSLLKAAPNDSLKILALYRLGEGYEFTARPQKGMDKYKECYDFAEETANIIGLARLDLKMGDINQVNNLFRISQNHYRKARSRLTKDKPGHHYYYYQAEYDILNVGLRIVEKTQAEKNQICDSIILMLDETKELGLRRYINRFTKLSKLCIIEHGYKGEKVKLESIKELESQYGNKIDLYHQLLLNGKIALKQGKYSLAAQYIQECEEIGRTADNIDIISNTLLLKKELSLIQDDYKSAYHIMEAYHTERSRLTEKQRINSFNRLEKELETANKTNEILMLSQQKNSLNSRARLYGVLAISLAGLLLLATIFFMKYRQKTQIIKSQNLILSSRKEDLESTNKIKDKLFAIISHDLRNTALVFQNISKKVNYLIDKGRLDELRKLAQEMDLTAYEFHKLLQNLLTWTLLQKEEMIRLPIEMNIQSAANEVVGGYKRIAEAKGVLLQSNIDSNLIAKIDPQVFRTILSNLLDNASKFCDQGDLVMLEITEIDDELVINVSDTGTGMSTKRRDTLFSFEHMEAKRGTKGEKGVGFGLILVHELLTLCKGKIDVKSEEGKGSSFEIKLPKSS